MSFSGGQEEYLLVERPSGKSVVIADVSFSPTGVTLSMETQNPADAYDGKNAGMRGKNIGNMLKISKLNLCIIKLLSIFTRPKNKRRCFR